MPEPYDILIDFPGWTPDFALLLRQEQSRDAGGRTWVKDFADPLWHTSVVSKSLAPNLLDYWRARLDELEEGLNTFLGYPLSRCYPILYPNGTWPTGGSFSGVSASLHTIGADRDEVRIGNLPAGFTFSIGDMLAIDYDLHRVSAVATADGAGLTPLFKVKPSIWDDVVTGGSPTVVVRVKRPACLMSIVPGTLKSPASPSTGYGTISFEALEARS